METILPTRPIQTSLTFPPPPPPSPIDSLADEDLSTWLLVDCPPPAHNKSNTSVPAKAIFRLVTSRPNSATPSLFSGPPHPLYSGDNSPSPLELARKMKKHRDEVAKQEAEEGRKRFRSSYVDDERPTGPHVEGDDDAAEPQRDDAVTGVHDLSPSSSSANDDIGSPSSTPFDNNIFGGTVENKIPGAWISESSSEVGFREEVVTWSEREGQENIFTIGSSQANIVTATPLPSTPTGHPPQPATSTHQEKSRHPSIAITSPSTITPPLSPTETTGDGDDDPSLSPSIIASPTYQHLVALSLKNRWKYDRNSLTKGDLARLKELYPRQLAGQDELNCLTNLPQRFRGTRVEDLYEDKGAEDHPRVYYHKKYDVYLRGMEDRLSERMKGRLTEVRKGRTERLENSLPEFGEGTLEGMEEGIEEIPAAFEERMRVMGRRHVPDREGKAGFGSTGGTCMGNCCGGSGDEDGSDGGCDSDQGTREFSDERTCCFPGTEEAMATAKEQEEKPREVHGEAGSGSAEGKNDCSGGCPCCASEKTRQRKKWVERRRMDRREKLAARMSRSAISREGGWVGDSMGKAPTIAAGYGASLSERGPLEKQVQRRSVSKSNTGEAPSPYKSALPDPPPKFKFQGAFNSPPLSITTTRETGTSPPSPPLPTTNFHGSDTSSSSSNAGSFGDSAVGPLLPSVIPQRNLSRRSSHSPSNPYNYNPNKEDIGSTLARCLSSLSSLQNSWTSLLHRTAQCIPAVTGELHRAAASGRLSPKREEDVSAAVRILAAVAEKVEMAWPYASAAGSAFGGGSGNGGDFQGFTMAEDLGVGGMNGGGNEGDKKPVIGQVDKALGMSELLSALPGTGGDGEEGSDEGESDEEDDDDYKEDDEEDEDEDDHIDDDNSKCYEADLDSSHSRSISPFIPYCPNPLEDASRHNEVIQYIFNPNNFSEYNSKQRRHIATNNAPQGKLSRHNSNLRHCDDNSPSAIAECYDATYDNCYALTNNIDITIPHSEMFTPAELSVLKDFMRTLISERRDTIKETLRFDVSYPSSSQAHYAVATDSATPWGISLSPEERTVKLRAAGVDPDRAWLLDLPRRVARVRFGGEWTPKQQGWFLGRSRAVVRRGLTEELGAEKLVVKEDGTLGVEAGERGLIEW